MVFVQGGTFQMGSKDGESDETPHSVTLSDYYIARHEVTVKEYLDFCRATNQNWPEWLEKGNKYNAQTGSDDYYKKLGQALEDAQQPIVGISWYNAVAYCNWRSTKDGLEKVYTINGTTITAHWQANGYRLPTEAEWEYAARSRGRDHKWAGTSSENQLSSYANSNVKSDGYEYTAPVGSFKANDLGLYDMSGNVYEWCWDWYDAAYYSNSTNTNPTGPNTGSGRVLRGGSGSSKPAGLRCANRNDRTPDNRYNSIGFRLSRAGR